MNIMHIREVGGQSTEPLWRNDLKVREAFLDAARRLLALGKTAPKRESGENETMAVKETTPIADPGPDSQIA